MVTKQMLADLALIDLETTGLSAAKGSIVEVHILIVDAMTLKVKKEYLQRVFPTTPVDPRAAAVNGYNEEVWKHSAIHIWAALGEIAPLLNGTRLAGWNPSFDWSFIEAAYKAYFKPTGWKRIEKWLCQKIPFGVFPRLAKLWPTYFPKLVTYRKIDVCSLAWPLSVTGLLESGSLVEVSHLLGAVGFGKAHTAHEDNWRTYRIYCQLMALYGPTMRQLFEEKA